MLTYDVEWARDCLPWSPGGLRLFDPGVQGARYFSVLVFRGLDIVQSWYPGDRIFLTPGVLEAGVCSPLVSMGLENAHIWCPGSRSMSTPGVQELEILFNPSVQGAGDFSHLMSRELKIVRP